MNSLTKPLLIGLLIALGCKETSPSSTLQAEFYGPKLVALCVEDIERSIHWYTQILGFRVEREIVEYPDYGFKLAFLEAGGFHLEILEMDKALNPSEAFSEATSQLGGFIKLGFKVEDLAHTFNKLKERKEVDFVVDLAELPTSPFPIPWPTQYFLIKDPDGNFIQFFDQGTGPGFHLWLSMIAVSQLDTSLAWYETNLGFQHKGTLGEEGNKRAILARENFILELFEPEQLTSPNQFGPDTTLIGVKKMAFGVPNAAVWDSVFKAKNTEIVIPLEESDFDWAKKALIAKDSEGNRIQIFEVEE